MHHTNYVYNLELLINRNLMIYTTRSLAIFKIYMLKHALFLQGTLFLERWKRKNATLAYEWDVDNFEHNEPDRPQFYGLKVKKDPVTQEPNWFYPFKKQMLKFAISISTLLFMVIS